MIMPKHKRIREENSIPKSGGLWLDLIHYNPFLAF